MNNQNAIVHFEIAVDDIERAQKFYGDIFGWSFNTFEMPEGDPYYGVTTTEVDDKNQPKHPGAINGGMMKRKMKEQPSMNYINVTSIDDMMKKIADQGGETCMPKTEIAPGMGWIACFKDPEANMMGLHQMPEKLKDA